MNIVVTVDKNWGIGYQKKPLVSIPEDLRYLHQETKGKVLVMGRKTYEQFSGGILMQSAKNLVLSSNPRCRIRGADVCHSVQEVLDELKAYPTEDIYVLGGERVYRDFLPYGKVAHVTRVDHAYEADAYFPDLSKLSEWVLTGESEERTYFNLEFTFCRYERQGDL